MWTRPHSVTGVRVATTQNDVGLSPPLYVSGAQGDIGARRGQVQQPEQNRSIYLHSVQVHALFSEDHEAYHVSERLRYICTNNPLNDILVSASTTRQPRYLLQQPASRDICTNNPLDYIYISNWLDALSSTLPASRDICIKNPLADMTASTTETAVAVCHSIRSFPRTSETSDCRELVGNFINNDQWTHLATNLVVQSYKITEQLTENRLHLELGRNTRRGAGTHFLAVAVSNELHNIYLHLVIILTINPALWHNVVEFISFLYRKSRSDISGSIPSLLSRDFPMARTRCDAHESESRLAPPHLRSKRTITSTVLSGADEPRDPDIYPKLEIYVMRSRSRLVTFCNAVESSSFVALGQAVNALN
ncbi:hypothetical protein RRG08_049932 [Elysia crispata]|uniref:Uncharacterized protein n=1 Tax=Elysia crispata TaxID=231223 RepID=A0AAE0Y0B4_9GAST|nr:hypothetical protein RRG08_049932 [Elysia crispata]